MNKSGTLLTEQIMQLSLFGLIITLPFSKSLVEFFLSVAFIAWVVHRIVLNAKGFSLLSGLRAHDTSLNIPIYILIFFTALSSVASVSLSLSIRAFFFKIS